MTKLFPPGAERLDAMKSMKAFGVRNPHPGHVAGYKDWPLVQSSPWDEPDDLSFMIDQLSKHGSPTNPY